MNDFIYTVNNSLPGDFSVKKAELFFIPKGCKKYAPASLLWGFKYNSITIPAGEEKTYRNSIKNGKTIYGLKREGILAKNPSTGEIEDYFELYRKFYPATL